MNDTPLIKTLIVGDKTLDIWDILGLNKSEKEIMLSLTKMAKSPAIISRHTEISKNTVSYTLNKLYKRGLARKIIQKNKRVDWKSNLPSIITYIRTLPHRKLGLF
jgi:DNA-binding MarR family transcriptional regulator